MKGNMYEILCALAILDTLGWGLNGCVKRALEEKSLVKTLEALEKMGFWDSKSFTILNEEKFEAVFSFIYEYTWGVDNDKPELKSKWNREHRGY